MDSKKSGKQRGQARTQRPARQATTQAYAALVDLEQNPTSRFSRRNEQPQRTVFILSDFRRAGSVQPARFSPRIKKALSAEAEKAFRKDLAITYFRTCSTIIGRQGLTVVFGMGTSVSPDVKSPEKEPLEVRLEKDETKKMIREKMEKNYNVKFEQVDDSLQQTILEVYTLNYPRLYQT